MEGSRLWIVGASVDLDRLDSRSGFRYRSNTPIEMVASDGSISFKQGDDQYACSQDRHLGEFFLHMPKLLFPPKINSTSLPGSYCSNTSIDTTALCPYQGLDDLVTKSNWTGPSNSITDISTGRVVATNAIVT